MGRQCGRQDPYAQKGFCFIYLHARVVRVSGRQLALQARPNQSFWPPSGTGSERQPFFCPNSNEFRHNSVCGCNAPCVGRAMSKAPASEAGWGIVLIVETINFLFTFSETDQNLLIRGQGQRVAPLVRPKRPATDSRKRESPVIQFGMEPRRAAMATRVGPGSSSSQFIRRPATSVPIRMSTL